MSSGVAVSSNDTNADIYYSSNGFVIRSSTSRNTVFYLDLSGSNLNDGEDSPLAQNSGQNGWTNRITDRAANYFFLYDQDLHYSKQK